MTQEGKKHLLIGISSRALFNLDDSHQVFEKEGIDAYAKYQITHENDILAPGVAFNLVKKLLKLKLPYQAEPLVEVILLSRNSADTGLRIFNSIQHHGLPITRAAFTSGESPYEYAKAFAVNLFLSAHPDDVRRALEMGIAAAAIMPMANIDSPNDELKIAFDGDAVLFSDEAESIYHHHGLDAFTQSETHAANIPLSGGPFKNFLAALHDLQQQFSNEHCPIRTALITARAAPAHERVIRTLRDWNIRIDEAIFLGGMKKGEFLKAFHADFFFDDQQEHCLSASDYAVAAGHVLAGVKNK